MTAPAAYLVRLKLSPAGYAMMESLLGRLNWLYNQALERRKLAYEQRQESLSFYDQSKWLTQLRAANEHGLGELALGASRGMLRRLDHAFQAFFRRVQAGEAPGFPRFRSIRRCVTIDVAGPHNGMVHSQNGHYLIRVKGFPRLRAYSGRSLPLDAPLKAVRLTKRGRKWEASLVYEVERQALPASVTAVGIDLGVRKRMTCSDGARSAQSQAAAQVAAGAGALPSGQPQPWQAPGSLGAACAQGTRAGTQRLSPGHDRDHPPARADRGRKAADQEHDSVGEGNGGGTGLECEGQGQAQPGGLSAELVTSIFATQVQGRVGRSRVRRSEPAIHVAAVQSVRRPEPSGQVGDLPLRELRLGRGSGSQCRAQHLGGRGYRRRSANVGRWAVRRSRTVCGSCLTRHSRK